MRHRKCIIFVFCYSFNILLFSKNQIRLLCQTPKTFSTVKLSLYESICDGVFPNNLKIAKVVPILKSGDSEIPTNYKPISVLTYFSKIFEKVLYIRLKDYFTKNSLISQQQYGFRNNHSTSLAITDLYENILQNLDKKLISCTVFVDLRKAFDSVIHSILSTKLEHYGVRGNAFKLIQFYLSNRKLYVQGGNIQSSWSSIISGVPQGSILGPLFFYVYQF